MHKVATSVFVVLLAAAMLIHVPFAYSQESEIDPCSLTQFDPNCSPSGWVAFIIGDVTLAVLIAALIYYLQRNTTNKLSEAIMFTQKVLRQEEESKRRQIIFVTQSLKNYFSGILMIAGLMNHHLINAKTYEDVPHAIRDKQEYMIRMASHSNYTLNLASHILDPMLTEQVRRFISTIEMARPESGVGKGFPRYDEMKKDIANITAKLDACVGKEDKILK